jgi:antitoxin YobK
MDPIAGDKTMNLPNISKEIIALSDNVSFVGKADETRIDLIEKELQILLPESYKWFLKEYGLAILPGFVILGNGLSNVPACVETTLSWRKYGLPESLVVIEDDGTDWIYCLGTSRIKNGECPVVDWEQNKKRGQDCFESFLHFFRARLKESINLL